MTAKIPMAFVGALVLISTFLLPVAQGSITAVNQCSFGLTVYKQDQSGGGRTSFNVPAGARTNLNVPSPWVGGVIWGSRNANTNNGQCTQLEFNINSQGRDYYDVSVVNAYNIAAQITVPSPNNDTPSGLECGAPKCAISNINSVCVMNNHFEGPDNACINGDGPGTVDTSSIQLFRNVCPQAYVQSNDNTNVVYACKTGSNYNVVFCP